MTDEQINDIIKSRRIPKDELDNFSDNFFGFIPSTMLLFVSTFSMFAKQTTNSMTIENKLIFVAFSLVLFLYTLMTKMREKKVKSIRTNLSKQENSTLIKKIADEGSWTLKTNKLYYKEYFLPFVFGQNGHKLTIILVDNEILYNLRNLGTSRGRMPYLFGIDTIKENRLRTKIKNYT